MKRMLSVILLALMLLVMLGPAALAAAGYEKALDSVVRIYTEARLTEYINGDLYASWDFAGGGGTGFAIGKKGEPVNTFVTNKHVVEEDMERLRQQVERFEEMAMPAGQYMLDNTRVDISYKVEVFPYVLFEDIDTKKAAVRTITSDKYDLACVIIATPTTDRKPAEIALYDKLNRDKVWALGFPHLTDLVIADGSINTYPSTKDFCTVTEGMAQVIAENNSNGSVVQHTADINTGNSGGPLVNGKGQVIGVNTWGYVEGDGKVNVSQNTKQLKQFLDNENLVANYTHVGGSIQVIVYAIIGVAVIIIALVAILLVRKKGGSKSPIGNRRILVCESGALAGHAPFALKAKTTIGREKAHPDIAFPDNTPGISGLHCTVTIENGQVKVRDDNSSYGTWIDNVKLQPGVPMVMHRGQRLYLGSKREVFILRS